MLDAVTAIISAIMAIFAAGRAVYIFRVAPVFSRKRLAFRLELSAPLIHESANSDSSLTVKYGKRLGKRTLRDPHIAHIRLANTGRKEVQSSDFDQATPMQLDLGVKIIELLKVTNSLDDMPDLTLSVTEKRLNIGPSLIPRHAMVSFILLINGPCTVITPKNPLTGVELIQQRLDEKKPGLTPRAILAWAALAFLLFFIIKDPDGVANLINNIGNFFSALARGISSFITNL